MANETKSETATAGASPQAIRAHYDVGDDFCRLWLGPEMVYSAALFDGVQRQLS